MNYFSIEGQTMAYQDIGQGPVLLLGHSYLWDSNMWAPQVEELSQSYRCIVPDFWGHGESEGAPQSMTNLKDYAQHMLQLMDELNIEHFAVIGLSAGGMWGTELTLLAPQRVTKLVIMDSFVGLEPEVTHQRYFGMLATIEQAQSIPEAIIEAVVPMFFSSGTLASSSTLVSDFSRRLTELKGQKALDVVRVGRMVFGRRDMFDELEQLTLPVLIMAGEEDKPRPMLESYLMSDCIDGAQLVAVPKAGHISNLEQPEFVTRQIKQFLSF
ncbi:alpha/beta hydrolase [Vibrio sp.]|nr:alpha/beta hydrolase [Vibrio sp.]